MTQILGRISRAAGVAVSSVLQRQREQEQPQQPNAAERGARPRQMRPAAQRAQDRTSSVREQAQTEIDRQRQAGEREAAIDAARAPPLGMLAPARQGPNPLPPLAPAYASFRPDYWTPRVPSVLRENPNAEIAEGAYQAPPMGGLGGGTRQATELAARVTNAPAGYLRALAGQEGLDNPDAQNPRSSATGLMQFTEDTWLSMLSRHGRQYGLPERLATAIVRRPNGSYAVRDRAARDELMRLRNSGEWSAIMGGHLFHEEAETMQRVRGRPVQVNEVYLGHFMGGNVAGQWIRMLDQGRGNVDARTAIREIYRSRGSVGLAQAQRIIDQNPRQFAPGMTVRRLYDMQTGEFVVHGIERGESREALTAIVRPVRRNEAKQSTLVPSRTLAAEQLRQQNADRFGDPNADRTATRDPFSGDTYVETAEERRMREQEEREIADRASRQRRTSVAIEGDRVRVRVPFN